MAYIVILISLHDSSLDAALLDDKHSWMMDLHFARVAIVGVEPSKLRKTNDIMYTILCMQISSLLTYNNYLTK